MSTSDLNPDAALGQIRELIGKIYRHWDGTGILTNGRLVAIACHLAEQTDALDEWLCRGGFPPTDWTQPPWTVRRPLASPRSDE